MINVLFSLLFLVLFFPLTSWSALSIEGELSTAVRNNDSAKIEELVKKGVKIDAPDDQGVPPLVRAAELGLADVLFKLIAAGADVNVTDDKQKRTPLMVAAGKGDTALVVLLLEAGADPTRVDASGINAIGYAKNGNAPDDIKTKLLEYSEERRKKFRTRGEAEPKKFIPVSVYYATNRKAITASAPNPVEYIGEPDRSIHYGVCEVSIPEVHAPGELESPSLEIWADPNKHIILQKVTELGEKDFFNTINRNAGNKEILIFIHGYNVSFKKAARRTAQLAYDLKFNGVPIFFSWPSNGNFLKYASDAENIQQSIPAISSFIMDVVDRFKPDRIHIIAHSMGTYGLTQALAKLSDAYLNKRKPPIFNQLVLAAPDIDADVFQKEIAPKITKLAKRVSLYSSSKDVAMTVSRYFNNQRRRAGDSDPEILTPKGIDAIDVSRVDTSLVGHSYYGSNNSIITDIKMVLSRKSLEERKFLTPRNNKTTNRKYWIFNPPQESL
jgi:esterase/lipase superfamily enzyme